MSNAVETVKKGMKQLFQEQYAEWRKIVDGLDADGLNWTPGEDTNSLAALVAHTCDANRFIMAIATGVTLDRDREGKFRLVASDAGDLLKIIDAGEAEVNGYVDRLTEDLLVAEQTALNRTNTGACWAMRALAHSREHLGHAFLTRQMYEQRS
jgi:hypothetical protein